MRTLMMSAVALCLWAGAASTADAGQLKLLFENKTGGEFTYRFRDQGGQVSGKGWIRSGLDNPNKLETGLIPDGIYTVEIWSGDNCILRETLMLTRDHTFVIFLAQKTYRWENFPCPR